jgi:hypothetical protein
MKFLIAFIVVFGLVGNMDYQDTLKEQDRYRAMVCEGSWSNYKELEIVNTGSANCQIKIKTIEVVE